MQPFWSWRVRAWRFASLLAASFLFVGFVASVAVQMQPQSVSHKIYINDIVARIAEQPTILGATSVRHYPKPPGAHVYHPVNAVAPLHTDPQVPVTYRITTKEPVIFITIDDGTYPDEAALRLMQQKRLTATLFLNDAAIHKHYDHFAQWQASGSTIQNHTVHHPFLPNLSFDHQKQEICDNNVRLKQALKSESTLFRPPYGEFNDDTLRAVKECGLKALVWWTAIAGDGKMYYQNTDRLHPGDIVLLHFKPHLAGDIDLVLRTAEAQGLKIGRLEDWLH